MPCSRFRMRRRTSTRRLRNCKSPFRCLPPSPPPPPPPSHYTTLLPWQSVSEEKEKTAAELEDRGRLAQQLQEEKKHLEDATSGLMGDLQSLQEQRRLIEEEKEHTEERSVQPFFGLKPWVIVHGFWPETGIFLFWQKRVPSERASQE